jgi:hypothetical protein
MPILPAYSSHFLLLPLTVDFLPSTSNAYQPSSSELSGSEFSSVESESEDSLVQLTKEVKQQPFTTSNSLEESLECRQ